MAAAFAARLLAAGCSDRPGPVDRDRPPRFEDYPATARWTGGEPAVPDLATHPDGSRFGSALWQGAQRGPDFAGRYTIVSRRCGRLCREFAIVDAVTGRVHPGLSDTPPFAYRLDSRLIAFEAPMPVGGRGPCVGCTATYYVWNDPHLEIVPPETWVGSVPPPPRLRPFVDSVRAAERPRLEDAGPVVLRATWDRLVIAVRDGTRLVYRDEVLGDTLRRLHVFRGETAFRRLVVETIESGGVRFQSIDQESGLVTSLDSLPELTRIRRGRPK